MIYQSSLLLLSVEQKLIWRGTNKIKAENQLSPSYEKVRSGLRFWTLVKSYKMLKVYCQVKSEWIILGDLVDDQISHLLASGSESEDENTVNKYKALVSGAASNGNSEFQIQSNRDGSRDDDDSDDNLISDEEKDQSETEESSSEDEQQKEELDLLMFDPEDQGKEDFAAEKQAKEKGKRKKKKRPKVNANTINFLIWIIYVQTFI